MPTLGVGFPLGPLERQQHAAADLEGILDALEPRRERLPLGMAEVGVTGSGGDGTIVVANGLAVGEHDRPIRRVNPHHLAEQDVDVALCTENRADGRGDVAGVERRGGDLVEHRLEEVVIPAIDHRHPDRRAPEPLGQVEPRESASHDDHVRHGRDGHSPIVSRRHCAKRTTSSTGGTAASSP